MGLFGQADGFAECNRLGSLGVPFLFVISYDKSSIFVSPLSDLDSDIYYKLGAYRNFKPSPLKKSYEFTKSVIDFSEYKKAFDSVIEHIKAGDTYLLNLTFKTPIYTDLSLLEIFGASRARYKLYFKGEFICFSPEKFIEIKDNTISTYPMKGTIDISVPNAKEIILANPKELAEHIMITDLMRNDIGMVASQIRVDDFRYTESIKAGEQELLQVSSKISGTLNTNWRENIGDLLERITPAGSITGTPKKSTMNIISDTEDYDRGFYTGVFGVVDKQKLSSAVMIRFIEKDGEKLYYKSGGGVTLDSDCEAEYEEMIRKVYLPF